MSYVRLSFAKEGPASAGSAFRQSWRSVTPVLLCFLLIGSCKVSFLCFFVFFSSGRVKSRFFVSLFSSHRVV